MTNSACMKVNEDSLLCYRLAPSLSLARGKGKGRREGLVKLDRISIVL